MNLLSFNGKSENLVSSSYQIQGNGSRDGHGGKGQEHKAMMDQIANEIFDKKIEQVKEDIYQRAYLAAYTNFIDNLSFDVETCVNLAFDDAQTILIDKKSREVIATHIMNEIRKTIQHKPY